MDPKLLQLIRDKILNVTTLAVGEMDQAVYLQEIRDAVLGVTTPSYKYGSLDSAIYLQQIRDAILGVTTPSYKYGSLDTAIYLQQIRDAYNSVTARTDGHLDDDIYLREILAVARPGFFSISGTVYDANGTTPVSGATIALGALNATSAANGTYTIANAPPGTSGSLTCTKSGYVWKAITVTSMSGNLASQNFTNAWWAAGGISASVVGAYQAIGAASLASSYVNLVHPGTHDLTVVVAPTWAKATGWAFNGTTQYLVTDIVPSAAQNTSAVVRFSNADNTAAAISVLGVSSGPFFLIQTKRAVNKVAYWNNGASLLEIAGAVATSGVLGIGGDKGYRNTAQEAGVIPFSANVTRVIYVGAYNDNGTSVVQHYKGDILGFAIYNTPLASATILAVMAALAALTGASVP
jgi:hypothetical protein